MQISKKALEQLRIIINGDETDGYRKGYQLVSFFKELGFHDVYGQNFPSRRVYTDDRLEEINGTPKLDECICNAFAVVNYIDRIPELDALIAVFNQYLEFDEWAVVRDNKTITLTRLDKVGVVENDEKANSEMQEDEFLRLTFKGDVDALGLDRSISDIIKHRLNEVESCVRNGAPLASILLIGSIMEGMLLGLALSYPEQFNQAKSSPKDKNTGQVRTFSEWTLSNYIDVASEIGLLKQDVKKFSHVVRDFRNYIHPYEQKSSQFSPDKQTALICFQVLKAAINQIADYQNSKTGGQS